MRSAPARSSGPRSTSRQSRGWSSTPPTGRCRGSSNAASVRIGLGPPRQPWRPEKSSPPRPTVRPSHSRIRALLMGRGAVNTRPAGETDVKHVWRMFAVLVAVVALGAGAGVAFADHGSGGGNGGKQSGKGNGNSGRHHGGQKATEVYTLDGNHGNPEGVAFDKRSGDFFVSSVGDGSIWRGELGDTADLVPTFIPP